MSNNNSLIGNHNISVTSQGHNHSLSLGHHFHNQSVSSSHPNSTKNGSLFKRPQTAMAQKHSAMQTPLGYNYLIQQSVHAFIDD